MRETGTVTDIKDGMAYVEFKRTSACGKCHACGMLSGQNSVTVKAKNSIDVKIGDSVQVEFTSKNALGSSAIAYLFPLGMLITGLLLGLFLPFEVGIEREVFAALMALGFTAVAFVVLRVMEPIFRKKFSNVYTITGIIGIGSDITE